MEGIQENNEKIIIDIKRHMLNIELRTKNLDLKAEATSYHKGYFDALSAALKIISASHISQ